MLNINRVTIISFISLFITACASDQVSDFDDNVSPGTASSLSQVRIAVLDQRPYILSGEKKPSYIGRFKLRLGKPYDGYTESGVPLAKEFTDAAVKILSNQFQHYEVVDLPDQKDIKNALSSLTSQSAERYVLVILKEWSGKTFVDTDLEYELKLAVYNQQGELLAQTKNSGNDTFGGNPIAGPVTNSSTAMEHAFKQKIKNLITDPIVKKALTEKGIEPLPSRQEEAPTTEIKQNQAEKSSDGKEMCTVRQILAMKNNGLKDEVILARCLEVTQ